LSDAIAELALAIEQNTIAFEDALRRLKLSMRTAARATRCDPRQPVALDVFVPSHLRYPRS